LFAARVSSSRKSRLGGVVVHDQDGQAPQTPRLQGRRSGRVRPAEAGAKVERASPANGTLRPEAAVHQLDEPGRDGQAQAGAAIGPRGGAIGLDERLEDAFELVGRDADAGVADGEVTSDE
jgi:hypothetical protein